MADYDKNMTLAVMLSFGINNYNVYSKRVKFLSGKRKPRKCLNTECINNTDHKGGYCSPECARSNT